MPYVDPKTRIMLDAGVPPETPGELAYCIQQQVSQYIEKPNFQKLSQVLGVIEGVKMDFVNRVLLPYEATKQKANGDVWQ